VAGLLIVHAPQPNPRPIYLTALVSGLLLALLLAVRVEAFAPLALDPPVLTTPADASTVTTPNPVFAWGDPPGTVISYTLAITGPGGSSVVTTTASVYTASLSSNGLYTWTVQAHNGPEVSGFVQPPHTFTLDAVWQVYLPMLIKAPPGCPTSSGASFSLIPIYGAYADHPDYLHGDLNLSLRGYSEVAATLGLVDYSGGVDGGAPQLAGLFSPNDFPGISAAYQVNDWNWACNPPDGCRGAPLTDWPTTLIGLQTTPGESISIPERADEVYGGGYIAMVLYAEERRLTLGYTREDTVAAGYAVHLENVCVDPNLLTLYQAQVDASGWRSTGYLPALKNNQTLGTAFGAEIQVAIRDRGSFMDPRSRKDWWWGY